jgi:hypothetical protein
VINPGDMIEWVYTHNNIIVLHNEQCYSTTMKQWIPIDGSMLLISVVGSEILFLRKEGLFRASADDEARSSGRRRAPSWVIPRERG